MKKVIFILTFIIILSGIYVKFNTKSSTSKPPITIKNVEALASGEYDSNSSGPLVNCICLAVNDKPCIGCD